MGPFRAAAGPVPAIFQYFLLQNQIPHAISHKICPFLSITPKILNLVMLTPTARPKPHFKKVSARPAYPFEGLSQASKNFKGLG